MKQLIAHDREIHLLTGHVSAGKSTYFRFLSELPAYQGPKVFKTSTDTVRVWHYANRISPPAQDNALGHLALYKALTPWETCVYNDELLYVDAERAILVDEADRVLLDTVVRSRKLHQQKLVDMVKRVRHGVCQIEKELATKRGMLPPNPPSQVNLRVVLLFCDFETARRRMLARFEHTVKEEEALIPLAESILPFETPVAYPFFAVNTSDESPAATKKRRQEIMNFLAGRITDEALMAKRREEAKQCIAASKRAARKWLKK